MFFEAEEAKKNWRYIRDQHKKKKRAVEVSKRSCAAAADVQKHSSWRLFPLLTWLNDTLEHQK